MAVKVYEDEDSGRKSRTRKKRESTALQRLGEELASMGESSLKDLSLPEDLLEAVLDWQRFSTHEAKRRQMQYIGKLMREIDDVDRLQQLMDDRRLGREGQTKALHEAEALRAALLEADEGLRTAALDRMLAAYPTVDSARLQHLVDGSLSGNKKTATRMSRELFRYLRDLVAQGEEATHDES